MLPEVHVALAVNNCDQMYCQNERRQMQN